MPATSGPDLVAGRWELLDPIASGGSSTVWRALDRRTGEVCAAKVLRRRDAGELLRFVREQSVRLDHPHVVAPRSWAAEEGTVLIASELVGGGSLTTLLGDNGPLSDGTIVVVLDQLLDALDAVHRGGLIHRDVKPGNVLLRVTGTGPLDLALVDFGIAIARSDARLTAQGTVVGTPGYLPPEVLRGETSPDVAHDLYALGCLAVALVVGHEGARAAEAFALVEDPALLATLGALLDEDPARRPADVAAVQRLLAPAARDASPHTRGNEAIEVLEQVSASPEVGEAPSAHVLPDGGANPGAPGRRRWVVAVVGAVVLGVGVGVGGWWVPGRGDVDPGDGGVGGTERGTATSTATSTEGTGAETGDPVGPGVEPGGADTVEGQACTWQQEGDRYPTAEGELVCTLADGAYAWRLP